MSEQVAALNINSKLRESVCNSLMKIISGDVCLVSYLYKDVLDLELH